MYGNISENNVTVLICLEELGLTWNLDDMEHGDDNPFIHYLYCLLF